MMRVVSVFERLEQLGQIGQLAGAIGEGHAIDARPALSHALEHLAKQSDVAAEPVGGGGGVRTTLAQHPLEIARDLFAKLQLLGSLVDLPGIRPVVGQAFSNLVGQGIHPGQGTVEQGHEIADRDHRIAPGQKGIDLSPDRLPAVFQFVQDRLHRCWRRRQSPGGAAVFLIVQPLLEAVAAVLEFGERRFLAARGLERLGYDRARQQALLAGQLEVGLVLRVLPSQGHEDDAHQRDEQYQRAQQRQIGDGEPFQNRIISRVTHCYFSLN